MVLEVEAVRARRLRPRDAAAARRALIAVHGRAASPRRVAAFLADPARHLYVATVGSRVAALAYGYELPSVTRDTTGFVLYEIDTLAAFRRRGAARAILDAMKRACRARGVASAWVPTNVSSRAAMALYRAAGGRRTHDDDVLFVWRFRRARA